MTRFFSLSFIALILLFSQNQEINATIVAQQPSDYVPNVGGSISSLAELRWLSETPSAWTINDTWVLVADIDAGDTKNWNGGKGFSPIGNGSAEFKGHLNGQGYTIKRLHINRVDEDYIGLFGKTSFALIERLILDSCYVKGRNYVGGLAGRHFGDIPDAYIIRNCAVKGLIEGDNYVGGISGCNHNNEIVGCFADVSVSGQAFVGALVGYVFTRSVSCKALVKNSYSKGSVTGLRYVGGIAGCNGDWELGYGMMEAHIYNSYSIAHVTGSNDVGALVGLNMSEVWSCFYNIDTTGVLSGIGTDVIIRPLEVYGLETWMFQDYENFSGWDFSNVFEIGTIKEGELPYPYLKWEDVTGHYSFTLTVSDNDGTLIPNAQVNIDEHRLFTGDSGRVQIALPGGSHVCRVYKVGYDGVIFDVNVSTSPIKKTIKLSSYAATFSVSDANGIIKGAQVEIIRAPEQDTLVSLTDSCGIARFVLPSGEHRYTIRKEGYVPLSALFQLNKSEVNNSVMLATQRMIFSIKDVNGMIANATISLWIDDKVLEQRADSTGRAYFDLPFGRHEYLVSKEGYADVRASVLVEEGGDSIEAVELATHLLEFHIGDANGNVAGASIEIHNETLSFLEMTDTLGACAFYVPAGVYNYVVVKAGYAKVFGNITVSETGVFKAVHLRANRLSFILQDANGLVYGARISTIVENKLVAVVTGADGRAELHVSSGTFVFEITKGGYDKQKILIDVSEDSTIRYTMPTSTVFFEIKDANGVVEGASLTLAKDDVEYKGFSDSMGTVAFNLMKGVYGYTLSKTGYATVYGEFTVDTIQQIESLSLPTNKANFVVSDAYGKVRSAQIVIYVEGKELIAQTDAEGMAFLDLPNGSHDFVISKAGYSPVRGQIKLAGSEQTVTIFMTFMVTFEVADFIGEVSGARIEINGHQLVTDIRGQVVVALPLGEFPYAVSKAGYEAQSGTVKVDGMAVDEFITLSSSQTVEIVQHSSGQMLICPNVDRLWHSYRWYKDGELVGSEQFYFENNGLNGNYYVVVRDKDSIRYTSPPVSIHVSMKKALHVYPSLVRQGDDVKVEFDGGNSISEQGYLFIHDSNGRLVRKMKMYGSRQDVSTAGMISGGFYVISYIDAEGKRYYKKVMVR